jgi:hypothetical protein
MLSETSVETKRTTQRHIPEDYTLHNHRCENLNYYNSVGSSVKYNMAYIASTLVLATLDLTHTDLLIV